MQRLGDGCRADGNAAAFLTHPCYLPHLPRNGSGRQTLFMQRGGNPAIRMPSKDNRARKTNLIFIEMLCMTLSTSVMALIQ